MDIISIINKNKGLTNKKFAQVYKDKGIAYKELINKSDALACYLIDKFGEDKSPIVIYGHKEVEMIISFLACMKSGHPYVPVDNIQPYERLKSIVENSRCKVVINNSEIECSYDNVLVIKKDNINAIIDNYSQGIPDESYRVRDNDTVYIIYTSGSTGMPKGVEISYNNLKYFISWAKDLYGKYLGSNEVFLNQVSYSFDVSVMNIFSALILGETLFTVDKDMLSNYKELFQWFKESDLSVWISTPSTIEMCLNDDSFDEKLLPKLKLVILAGETLSIQCVEKIMLRFPNIKIINGYGPTEATILSTYIEITKEILEREENIPIGYPLEGSRVVIKDEFGRNLEEKQKGEIYIIGKNVGKGYYLNEEATQNVFSQIDEDSGKNRCYRTGDIGFIKKGLVYYCGRKDFQIKLNGNRIELEDIENNLKKINCVKNAIVLCHKVTSGNQYLCAFIILKGFSKIENKKLIVDIKKELKKYVPNYMIPKKIIIKDEFPVNVNGKIDRKILIDELNLL